MLPIAIGVVLVAGFLLLEYWGRQPVIEPLTDMRTFNAGVVLLVRRGFDGAALRLEWKDSSVLLFVEKRVRAGQPILLVVRDSSASPLSVDSAHEVRTMDFIGDRLTDAATGETVRAVRHALEEMAARHEKRLVPDALISYQGHVANFNIPERTGVPSDGKFWT